jgi:ACS family hexuronate transporter-like MFS transporter
MPYRWRIVALLFFLSVINYLDRQALSVLAPSLRQELDFTAVHYSYVVVSFLVAYTIGYLFCGNVIDRLGVRVAVTVALAAWSVAGMLHALAFSWVAFAVCRFLLGLGESFNSPSGIKAITEWVPRRERGLCMAVFSNGNIVGAILAPPLVSFIALRFGWQWGFLVTGGLGFIYLAFWLTMYRSPETHPRLSPAERAYILSDRPPAHAQARISIFTALTHPLCLGFMFARLFTDSLSYFFSFWLPEYLQSARGFSLAMIGIFGWIPFLASDVGGPGGGALSDWLVRRGWNPIAARKRMLLLAACLMPASLIAVHADSAYVALGLIAVLLAAQSCWNTNLLTLMSECFPREHVATYVSVAGIGGSIGGIISTLLAGQIIGTFGYVPVFTTLGFLHVTAFSIILFFMRRHTRAQAAAAVPA